MMDICVDDPEARLARQLDRQINEELKRAKHQMVVGKIFQIKYKDLALGREYTGLKHRIR